MKFLIDECLHTSLVAIAIERGHEASHVNWLGLSGTTDWGLMPRIIAEDFTFVTNNAADFRALYRRENLHAGLVIIIPQLVPARQRALFDKLLEILAEGEMINTVIEIEIVDGDAVLNCYQMPDSAGGPGEE